MIETLLIGAFLVGSHLQSEGEWDQKQQALDHLREFYLQAGVLGPEEKDRYFYSAYQLEYDLDVMLYREKNLQPDSPPFSFVLPPASLCRQNYLLSRKFVNYLEKRIQEGAEPAHEEDLQLVLWEAKWRSSVWGGLDDASSVFGDYEGKRLRLETVRRLVGKDKFDLAQWPDPLPKAALNSAWDWTTNPY